MTMPQPEMTTAVPAGLPMEVLARAEEELQTSLAWHESRLDAEPEPDDISMAVHRRSLEAHEEVAAALTRIEDGSFGTCVTCQSPIPLDRLEAMPHAAHCTRCAGRK